jgi:predicted RNase H-like HicB family nuclease
MGLNHLTQLCNVHTGETPDDIREFMRSVIDIFINSSIEHAGSQVIIR